MADGQLLPERAIRELNEVKKIVLGQTRTNRARRRRRRVAGDGGGSSFGAMLAVVTDTATKNGGSVGKCVLLNDALQMIDKDGNVTAAPSAADKLEFKSAHQYADCRAGMRIWLLSADDIVAGATWSTATIWGQLTDVLDYLRTRPNFAEKKVLFIPTGGTTAESIDWYGKEC